MKISSKLLTVVPQAPGIYSLYERKDIIYVGIGDDMRKRLRQHFIRRDSSIVTSVGAARLHLEFITRVAWWTCEEFEDRNYLEAAELVAFEYLNPVLRSRGKPRAKAKSLIDDPFKKKIISLFD